MSVAVYPQREAATPSAIVAYAPKSGHQTGVTSEVAVTELAASVFLRPNRTYVVEAWLNLLTNTNDQGGQARLKMDGAEIQFSEVGSARGRFTLNPRRVLMPGQFVPGPHVFTVTVMKTGASNAVDVNSWGTDPSYLLVEDVTGGSGGPGPILLAQVKKTITVSGISTAGAVIASLTVNVPAGRTLEVAARNVGVQNTTTNRVDVRILEGGALLGIGSDEMNKANVWQTIDATVLVEPTPGTHTYDFLLQPFVGTGTLDVGGTWPALFTVKDVTGTEAPSGAYYEALWTPVTTFLNGWVNHSPSGPYPPVAYRRVNDLLYLRGLVKSGTVANATALFQLPVGYRPVYTYHVPAVSNDVPTFCRVQNDGYVTIGANVTAAWFSLDGVVVGLT